MAGAFAQSAIKTIEKNQIESQINEELLNQLKNHNDSNNEIISDYKEVLEENSQLNIKVEHLRTYNSILIFVASILIIIIFLNILKIIKNKRKK